MHGAPDGPYVALLNRCRGGARGDPMVSTRETTAGGGVALGRPVAGTLLGGRRAIQPVREGVDGGLKGVE